MKAALKQAEKAIALGEVPIGAVIVYEGKIIARGYNRRNTDKTTLAHAEIACIRKACKKIGDWRLEGCTLYCTLEPCQMCAGAIVQSRIDRVVIGTTSPKSGCGGTLLNILQNPDFNHQCEVIYDVLREECTEVLQRFFKDLRRRNKERKKMLRMQAMGAAPETEAIPAQPVNAVPETEAIPAQPVNAVPETEAIPAQPVNAAPDSDTERDGSGSHPTP